MARLTSRPGVSNGGAGGAAGVCNGGSAVVTWPGAVSMLLVRQICTRLEDLAVLWDSEGVEHERQLSVVWLFVRYRVARGNFKSGKGKKQSDTPGFGPRLTQSRRILMTNPKPII